MVPLKTRSNGDVPQVVVDEVAGRGRARDRKGERRANTERALDARMGRPKKMDGKKQRRRRVEKKRPVSRRSARGGY